MRHVMNLEEIIHNQNNKIQVLEAELNLYQKRCEQYAQAYDQMQQQLKDFIRNRFGKKSERYIDDPENPQMSLFGEPDKFSAADEAGNQIQDDIKVPAHTRKKNKNSKKDIPVRIEIIPVPDEEKQCSC